MVANKNYFCPECLKKYCYGRGLKKHLINKHNAPPNTNIDDSYRLDADKVIIQKIDDEVTDQKLDVHMKKESGLYDYLICPITQQIYYDPVIAKDGITYERSAILEWLKNSKTSPITRKKIPKTLYPNLTIKNIKDIFIKNNPQYAIDQYNPKKID